MALENAERRLDPYEERIEYRPFHYLQGNGRNTKFPFDRDHPERSLFFNPAVNYIANKGYEDGDNNNVKFLAPSGFVHDPKKKLVVDANSIEANIWKAEWRAEHGISEEEFAWIFDTYYKDRYNIDGSRRQPPHH